MSHELKPVNIQIVIGVHGWNTLCLTGSCCGAIIFISVWCIVSLSFAALIAYVHKWMLIASGHLIWAWNIAMWLLFFAETNSLSCIWHSYHVLWHRYQKHPFSLQFLLKLVLYDGTCSSGLMHGPYNLDFRISVFVLRVGTQLI